MAKKDETDTSAYDAAIDKAHETKDTFGEDREVSEVVKFKDIVGQVVVVDGYKRMTGQRGDYFFIYMLTPNHPNLVGMACGSAVVMEKLDKIKEYEMLPCKVTFLDKGKYYDLS